MRALARNVLLSRGRTKRGQKVLTLVETTETPRKRAAKNIFLLVLKLAALASGRAEQG